MRLPSYEVDETAFPAEAYRVKRYDGIAWRVYGWQLEHVQPEPYWDEDLQEWMGSEWDEPEERRTGLVVCVMVGDDRKFNFDPSELTPLDDLEYCGVCGQVGCSHDGRDRSDG